jgi:hypothetical protein
MEQSAMMLGKNVKRMQKIRILGQSFCTGHGVVSG